MREQQVSTSNSDIPYSKRFISPPNNSRLRVSLYETKKEFHFARKGHNETLEIAILLKHSWFVTAVIRSHAPGNGGTCKFTKLQLSSQSHYFWSVDVGRLDNFNEIALEFSRRESRCDWSPTGNCDHLKFDGDSIDSISLGNVNKWITSHNHDLTVSMTAWVTTHNLLNYPWTVKLPMISTLENTNTIYFI
jgi:hypothetical protein